MADPRNGGPLPNWTTLPNFAVVSEAHVRRFCLLTPLHFLGGKNITSCLIFRHPYIIRYYTHGVNSVVVSSVHCNSVSYVTWNVLYNLGIFVSRSWDF